MSESFEKHEYELAIARINLALKLPDNTSLLTTVLEAEKLAKEHKFSSFKAKSFWKLYSARTDEVLHFIRSLWDVKTYLLEQPYNQCEHCKRVAAEVDEMLTIEMKVEDP